MKKVSGIDRRVLLEYATDFFSLVLFASLFFLDWISSRSLTPFDFFHPISQLVPTASSSFFSFAFAFNARPFRLLPPRRRDARLCLRSACSSC